MRSNIISQEFEKDHFGTRILAVALGSVFLALIAQASIKIPFTPVPVTLQTLGIWLIALALPKREAFFAVIAYLAQATLGLPVLAGGTANPLWILSPSAGYLLSWPFAVYLIGYLLELKKERTFAWTLVSLISGKALVYLIGCSYLSFFVGAENAIALGLLPFMVGGVLKIAVALSLDKPMQLCKKYFNLF